MNFKAFLILLAALLVVFAISFLIIQNHDVLLQSFTLYGDIAVPVSVVVGLAFCLGLLISIIWIMFSGVHQSFLKWRIGRRQRFHEALELDYSRGMEEIVSGRPDSALNYFQQVLVKDDKHVRALLRAGEMERSLGYYEEAIDLHQKALHYSDDSVASLYALADDYEISGDWNREENCLKRIIDLKPKMSPVAHRRLNDLYIRQGKWDEAEALHDVSRSWFPKKTRDEEQENLLLGIQYQIGLEKQKASQLKEAVARFRKIIKRRPDFIPAYMAMGESYLLGESHNSALEIWENGFMATNSPVFLVRITDYLLERDGPERAIEIHRRVAARASKNIVARFMLGKLYYRLEMIDDAQEVFQGLKESLAHSPTLHYLLARIGQRRGDLDGAVDSYRRAILMSHTVDLQYQCANCSADYTEWHDRCHHCGVWNTIEVLMKENVPLEDLGLSTRPVYLPEVEEPLLIHGKVAE